MSRIAAHMKVKGNTKRFAVSEETGRIKTKLVFSEKKKKHARYSCWENHSHLSNGNAKSRTSNASVCSGIIYNKEKQDFPFLVLKKKKHSFAPHSQRDREKEAEHENGEVKKNSSGQDSNHSEWYHHILYLSVP